MRFALILATALTVSACGAHPDTPAADVAVARHNDTTPTPRLTDETLTRLQRYTAEAEAMVTAVDDGEDVARLAPRAQSLLDLSLAMLPYYLAVRPECEAYLNAAATIAMQWPNLTPDAIEADYHRDGALPMSEHTAVCYHMKDLIVHPATALALLQLPEPPRDQVRHEIHEVAVHAGVVAQQP
jgi:hypothetical protein